MPAYSLKRNSYQNDKEHYIFVSVGIPRKKKEPAVGEMHKNVRYGSGRYRMVSLFLGI